MIIGLEKSEKILKTAMLTWNMQTSITLLITDVFVIRLAVHETKHLNFIVQKCESYSVFRIEEHIV